MDIPLPGEEEEAPMRITDPKNSFQSLKLIDVSLSDNLSGTESDGVNTGTLENGLHYYVRSNPKPKKRAALALALKIGSIVEEENERGVAHIVEHLAFSATKKYTNHDIVKFLEGIGAEFGACQNASTSEDETIYELFVPVDKPELLSQALSVLAEFSSEVRVSAEDLDKERGAVLEEYRGSRNAHGRMHDAHWLLMMEGSKYAERQPIGLEKVIRTVSPETVKQFYQKWYRLNNMAVVVVGDFSDTQSVVELIKMHFGPKVNTDIPSLVPYYPVPSHTEPRFLCFVESEACGTAVMISCKMPSSELKTVKDYKDSLAESMFFCALNQRYFKLCRRKDPPCFSCSSGVEEVVRSVKAYTMSASCKENGTIEALESMLMEIARVRLHGFTEREISIARTLLMSDIESIYLERDQLQSTDLRDEYVQHFLYNEPVLEIEFEAQLQKTLFPQISAAEVSKYAENFRTTCSCVVKTMEPQSHATVDDLKAVLLKVNLLEEERNIFPWDEDHIPEEIITTLPDPGSVIQQSEYPNIGITELLLSNGMRVCYKCTDFLDNQVLFNGYSYGGLSEISEDEYLSCSMSSSIAKEIGVFGYKPSILTDMLAGKRADFNTKVGSYMRNFCGECSPIDLETALQLVYKCFTTNIVPAEEEVKFVMDRARESVRARERDPYTVYANRVRELNYGSSYYFKPMTMNDLEKVDPRKACEFFNRCFQDPSTFTVVIVGNLNPSLALPLILQYLGGIPKPPEPVLHLNRDEVKALPYAFPATIIREVVRSPMVEAQCSVQLSFPVNLKSESMIKETHFVGFLTNILETKIMQILRFKHGHIYSVSVNVFLGGNGPWRSGDVHGDISVKFSCDPNTPWKLVRIVLDEILRLQTVGPSEEDILSVLEIEQRGYENGLQENCYWLNRIMRSYQSRLYSGDVQQSFDIQEKGRKDARESLTASVAQCVLQRVLPNPCTKQYTVVILMPQMSRMKMVKSFCDATFERYTKQVKILGVVSGAMLLAVSLWRFSRHSKSGV